MPKKLKTAFISIFRAATALYLGFALWSVFLKTFMADSLETPTVLLSAIGLVFVLRWLASEEPAPDANTHRVAKPQVLKMALFAPDQQHVFRVRKKNASCRQTGGSAPNNQLPQSRCIKSATA